MDCETIINKVAAEFFCGRKIARAIQMVGRFPGTGSFLAVGKNEGAVPMFRPATVVGSGLPRATSAKWTTQPIKALSAAGAKWTPAVPSAATTKPEIPVAPSAAATKPSAKVKNPGLLSRAVNRTRRFFTPSENQRFIAMNLMMRGIGSAGQSVDQNIRTI